MKHINDFKLNDFERKKNTINTYNILLDVLLAIDIFVTIIAIIIGIFAEADGWLQLIGMAVLIISLVSWGVFKLFGIIAEAHLDNTYIMEIIARSIINDKDDT